LLKNTKALFFISNNFFTVQLKQIEIKGFKSFADRTVINFNNSMTGIVGPNGCGKSNTVDAIRWVLGEQKSRALRLDKMDNVLFNGTKKRPAAGRAEVSLTFENTRNLLPTEFATVTITRILYRTGESEYRLNEVRCRLKDISNLFSDTGISSDSYAIIELKMIDEILNDNEDSRRRLFEQAAGISKYKLRKKETMQKLNATDADLSRVEDLLFEIEANLKTLEKQAKKTERYYKLREQYKELAIELALHNLGEYANTRERLSLQLQNESDRRIQIEAIIATAEAEAEKQKTIAISRERNLAEQQRIVNQIIAQLRDDEAQKNLLLQNIKHLSERQSQLTAQINQASAFSETLTQEIEHLTWDKNAEQTRSQEAAEQVKKLQQNADIVREQHRQSRQTLEKLQETHRHAELNVFDLEKQIAVQQTQYNNLQRETNDNAIRFQNQSEELAELQQQLKKAEVERKKADENLQNYLAEEEEQREEIALAERSLDNKRQQLANINRQLDAQRNEFKLTKSLVDSLEGFPDSIKFLKTNKEWNGQNTPLLLDIINCPDEYKAAIENYLKPYLNHYLVPTSAEAAQAIALLDKAQKGKAQFFVLSELDNKQATKPENKPALASEQLLPALSVVTVAPMYQNLINLLLDKVYIATQSDNIESTFQALNQNNDAPNAQNIVLIGKDGKQMRGIALLGGGSVGSFEGKRIGKRQQLVQLENNITQLSTDAQQIEQQMNEGKNKISQQQNNLKSKLQLINHQRQELSKLQNQTTQLKAKIESNQRFMDDNRQYSSSLQQQLLRIKQTSDELQSKLSIAKTQQNTDTNAIAAAEELFRQAQRDLTQANQTFNEQNIEFHKQQNRLSSIMQNLGFKEKQLIDTTQQHAQNQQALQQTTAELSQAENEKSIVEQNLIKCYADRSTEEDTLRNMETAYYAIRNTLDEQEKELKRQQKNKEQCDQIINQTNDQLNRLDIQFLSIKERLSIEFKVEMSDLKNREPSPEFTREDLEIKVAKQKQQLETYGEINPLAIEAYNEIKERYDFIIAQREDLSNAKKSLLQTIKEIETVATKQFMEAFNKARENFIQVFRSLFTDEDQCDLILVEPNNPLESPIDIVAKPKGKRPQSINQLSGGEKSLTALAMVFSLYLLKPAPFCILDEVDAPLDDANVTKFTNIIRRFSADSQFIVVTHNKNTMAAVDIIYGVTMHEEGVSRVVPVDFSTLQAN
jgi:chromosome segregation protein